MPCLKVHRFFNLVTVDSTFLMLFCQVQLSKRDSHLQQCLTNTARYGKRRSIDCLGLHSRAWQSQQHGIPRASTREERTAEARQRELREIEQYKTLVADIQKGVSTFPRLCSLIHLTRSKGVTSRLRYWRRPQPFWGRIQSTTRYGTFDGGSSTTNLAILRNSSMVVNYLRIIRTPKFSTYWTWIYNSSFRYY